MILTFHCRNCDDSFERDYAALVDASKGTKCDGCGKKLPAADLEELLTALDEVFAQVAALKKRFVLSFDVEGDDLPAPYDGRGGGRAKARDDDDEDEEEDDEESDDVDQDDDEEESDEDDY